MTWLDCKPLLFCRNDSLRCCSSLQMRVSRMPDVCTWPSMIFQSGLRSILKAMSWNLFLLQIGGGYSIGIKNCKSRRAGYTLVSCPPAYSHTRRNLSAGGMTAAYYFPGTPTKAENSDKPVNSIQFLFPELL